MDIEGVINEARGYLNALRLQCEEGTTMWINCFPMQNNLETTVNRYINKIKDDFTCKGIRNVKFDDLLPVIRNNIFSKIKTMPSETVIKDLEWQFIEYYGLASTIEDENNPFNPLVSNPSVLIELESNEYEISACFITPVGKHIVVTTFGKVI